MIYCIVQSNRTPRQPTGAPGGLKVVAANGTVEVEHFAGQEKAGDAFAHHRELPERT